MSERKSREFMGVDSFSQLPFIRPAAAPPGNQISSPKLPPATASAVRLFGIVLPHDAETTDESSASKVVDDSGEDNNNKNNTGAERGGSGGESGRKFECHYCCRNFPTSQALGGHQNAHKRERQHAKRVQFQSMMPPPPSYHYFSGGSGGGENFHCYHRRLEMVPSPARFTMFDPPPPPHHYPSWNTTNASTRFYGGTGSVSQPIPGSPLTGPWKVPVSYIHGNSTTTTATTNTTGVIYGNTPVMPNLLGAGSLSLSSTSTSPQHLHESPVNDGVSLDLHL